MPYNVACLSRVVRVTGQVCCAIWDGEKERECRVLVREDVLSTVIGDEVVLLDVSSGNYFGLSEVAAEIWRMLEKPHSIDDLCSNLGEIYDAPPDVISAAVKRFTNDLMTRKLVRQV